MSQVCAKAKGRPRSEHVACTGCEGCWCHHVAAPPGRVNGTYKQVRIGRGMPPRRTPDPEQRGEALPGPGTGGVG